VTGASIGLADAGGDLPQCLPEEIRWK
jgi:hypothetical protein